MRNLEFVCILFDGKQNFYHVRPEFQSIVSISFRWKQWVPHDGQPNVKNRASVDRYTLIGQPKNYLLLHRTIAQCERGTESGPRVLLQLQRPQPLISIPISYNVVMKHNLRKWCPFRPSVSRLAWTTNIHVSDAAAHYLFHGRSRERVILIGADNEPMLLAHWIGQNQINISPSSAFSTLDSN